MDPECEIQTVMIYIHITRDAEYKVQCLLSRIIGNIGKITLLKIYKATLNILNYRVMVQIKR